MIKVNNKSDVAEIYLSGDIVDDVEGSWIDEVRFGDSRGYEFPSKLRQQLDLVKDKELEIHINSYGGSVFAGVAMANFVKNHKAKTTCIIDGIAASIASQIFFSADVCKIPANGYLMLHKPFAAINGNAEELRKTAEILDTIQCGLEETYLAKLKDHLSIEDLRQMLNSETWLTGSEAAQKFQVELLDPVKTLNCVGNKNRLKMFGFNKIPESLNFVDTLNEQKVKNTLARAKEFL